MMVFGFSGAFETSEVNMSDDPDMTIDRVIHQSQNVKLDESMKDDLRIGHAGQAALTLAKYHDSDYKFVA